MEWCVKSPVGMPTHSIDYWFKSLPRCFQSSWGVHSWRRQMTAQTHGSRLLTWRPAGFLCSCPLADSTMALVFGQQPSKEKACVCLSLSVSLLFFQIVSNKQTSKQLQNIYGGPNIKNFEPRKKEPLLILICYQQSLPFIWHEKIFFYKIFKINFFFQLYVLRKREKKDNIRLSLSVRLSL